MHFVSFPLSPPLPIRRRVSGKAILILKPLISYIKGFSFVFVVAFFFFSYVVVVSLSFSLSLSPCHLPSGIHSFPRPQCGVGSVRQDKEGHNILYDMDLVLLKDLLRLVPTMTSTAHFSYPLLLRRLIVSSRERKWRRTSSSMCVCVRVGVWAKASARVCFLSTSRPKIGKRGKTR